MIPKSAYPHIEKLPNEPARLERLPRLRVAQIVMDDLAHGWSPDEMCRQHPNLTEAEAHAAMGYYYDHQEEINGEIQAELAQTSSNLSESAPSPFYLRMRAKGLL
ncbi:MAG TPA: DUF433 domain-containing protein [Pirellulales bacterium]|jgi:hypothetical protein|nr:DUF433 domain-containing protein [Pirellulales bacterium]